jgi:hypothetical protein
LSQEILPEEESVEKSTESEEKPKKKGKKRRRRRRKKKRKLNGDSTTDEQNVQAAEEVTERDQSAGRGARAFRPRPQAQRSRFNERPSAKINALSETNENEENELKEERKPRPSRPRTINQLKSRSTGSNKEANQQLGASFLLEDVEPTTERQKFAPKFIKPRGRSSGLTAFVRKPIRPVTTFAAEDEQTDGTVGPGLETEVQSTSNRPTIRKPEEGFVDVNDVENKPEGKVDGQGFQEVPELADLRTIDHSDTLDHG